MQHKSRTALLIALLVGVAGTIQYYSTQFRSGFDTFFGDRGDARGFVYFCEHWYQSILGKASLLSPGIFYPTKRTLAYSDLLLGFATPYAFFRALGFNEFTSVEFVIILFTFLSYCVAFILLRRILGFGVVPACVGAMFFAFNSPKFNQLTHLQLQYVLLLPVILALVITFAKQAETISQKRAAVILSLTAVCLNLQLATTFYYAWFLVFWSILFFLLSMIFPASRHFILTTCRKFWPALITATGVFLVGFIPFVLLYLPTLRNGTWYRYDFISEMIPDWRAALSLGDGNYVWGWLYKAIMPEPRPATWGELMVGIGLIPALAWIALAVSSIWFVKSRRQGRVFLGIAIMATTLFLLIGFRYGGYSPWKYIYQFFPGAGAIRAVSRYVIFLTLPLSIAFAYGLQMALEFASARQNQLRRRVLTVAILLIAAFGVFEQFGVPKINGTGFSQKIERRYLEAMAGKLASDCSAFYIAPGTDANHSVAEYQYDAMLISVLSRVKTLNASSSQFPHDWNMYFVKNSDYDANVKQWIESRGIKGKVCRLEVGPQVEAFDPNMPNLIDDPEFFVRQLYRDFAGREPDAETVNSQVRKITSCRGDDESCERAHVALSIFLSTGFHERGFFILRMYEAGLQRLPTYQEFSDAMQGFNDSQTAKDRLIAEFIQQHNDQRSAESLRQQIDSDELVRRLGNRSFVVLHYFGYLRRDPDGAGMTAWQDLLDRSGDSASVTDGFITSTEYRERFRK